jgi:quinol monooxygenase YgiN
MNDSLNIIFWSAFMPRVINRRSVLSAGALTILGLAAASVESTVAQLARRSMQRSSKEVTLIVRFQVKPALIETFKRRFIPHTELSRQEPGCVIFNLYQSNKNPQIYWLYEIWQDQAALDFHFAQTYTKEIFEFLKESLEVPVEAGLDFVTEIAPLPLRNDRK